MRYHSHLFGHEGENSLLSWLISEGLALELCASSDHNLWSTTNFDVDITLTKKGLAEYERVIEAVFRYAQLIRDRGVQDYVFEETKRLGEIEFDFADKGQPLGWSKLLASKMQLFEEEDKVKDLIRHMYVVQELDKPRIQQMSELIADPRKMNVYLRSKSVEKECNLEDKWGYKAKYCKAFFNEDLLGKMTNP